MEALQKMTKVLDVKIPLDFKRKYSENVSPKIYRDVPVCRNHFLGYRGNVAKRYTMIDKDGILV